MATLCIAYINDADAANLAANPAEASDGPIRYLQSDSRGYKFTAAAVGSQEIKGDWNGLAKTVGHVRIDRTNLVDGDTWRIQLYSDAAWTVSVYDSTAVSPFTAGLFSTWGYSFAEKWFAVPVAGVKSFKITVVSAAVFSASRLFVGAYVAAQWNPKYGMSLGWDDDSKGQRLDGGTLSVLLKDQWRVFGFDMFATTEAERAIWLEIGRYCGKYRSVAMSVFPNTGGTQERDFSALGKFDQSPAIKWANFGQHDFSLKLLEI